jgi:hypothetical protein
MHSQIVYNHRFSPREAQAETAKKCGCSRRAPPHGLSSYKQITALRAWGRGKIKPQR